MHDIYELALEKLRADPRSFNEIAEECRGRGIDLSSTTLRDLNRGNVSDPRINTLRKLAQLYLETNTA